MNITNNYENILSIELEDPLTSLLGSMKVDGNVNNEIGFSITLHDDFTIAGVSTDEGFPEEKEECKEQDCVY
ncbi:hypothetical protein [Roseburia sp. 1XD42-34]|uniref:hypothetical protein n=1 Tax=Roseburia sp. 1XD42-34 TaxID=2305905 RepID=UPI000EA36DD9|nr:hypothetical protein [Roseburia sp. 1XD42-34]NBJ69559.1 hypothetical protein [Roseburia sp. 1XD42-34]RKI78631.1 hypothetical protein D7V87_08770 [Clostridium sp. 1xD42-85]